MLFLYIRRQAQISFVLDSYTSCTLNKVHFVVARSYIYFKIKICELPLMLGMSTAKNTYSYRNTSRMDQLMLQECAQKSTYFRD